MAIPMRLDKYLSHMGYGTRKEVKDIIKNGWVTIDGKTIKKADTQVKDDQKVYVDDQLVEYIEFEYYMLHKPAGYICATEDSVHPTVMELIRSKRTDLYPVGRLDLDTEGLLLITNDGQFTHDLLSPKKHVFKTYYVEFDGTLPEDAVELFKQPMEFEDFTSQGGTLEIIDSHRAYLTIHEGKFHQVKRMFLKVHCEVTYLKRIKFAGLTLDGLECGEFRELTPDEVCALKK